MPTPEENVRQVAERLGLAELSNLELLRGHAAILEELNERSLLRTRNSPVSGYAEWLVSTVYPQPEFEDKTIVSGICDESSVSLFRKLCKRSGLR